MKACVLTAHISDVGRVTILVDLFGTLPDFRLLLRLSGICALSGNRANDSRCSRWVCCFWFKLQEKTLVREREQVCILLFKNLVCTKIVQCPRNRFFLESYKIRWFFNYRHSYIAETWRLIIKPFHNEWEYYTYLSPSNKIAQKCDREGGEFRYGCNFYIFTFLSTFRFEGFFRPQDFSLWKP